MILAKNFSNFFLWRQGLLFGGNKFFFSVENLKMVLPLCYQKNEKLFLLLSTWKHNLAINLVYRVVKKNLMLNAINQFSLQKIADLKCIAVGFAKKTESNWIIQPVFFLANFNELPISLSKSSLNQNNKKKMFRSTKCRLMIYSNDTGELHKHSIIYDIILLFVSSNTHGCFCCFIIPCQIY